MVGVNQQAPHHREGQAPVLLGMPGGPYFGPEKGVKALSEPDMHASISSTVRGTQVSSSTPVSVTATSSSMRTWARGTGARHQWTEELSEDPGWEGLASRALQVNWLLIAPPHPVPARVLEPPAWAGGQGAGRGWGQECGTHGHSPHQSHGIAAGPRG